MPSATGRGALLRRPAPRGGPRWAMCDGQSAGLRAIREHWQGGQGLWSRAPAGTPHCGVWTWLRFLLDAGQGPTELC